MFTKPASIGYFARFLPALRPSRVATLFLACSLGIFPATSRAQVGPFTAFGFGPDDLNVSTLYPIAAVRPIESAWLLPSLTRQGFTPAAGWNFVFASAADSKFVLPDLAVTDYLAWVVNSPTLAGLDGHAYSRPVVNEDAGGAAIQLHYTPVGTDPVNIHFLSGYNQSLNGGPFQAFIDNPFNPASPFYDPAGAGGLLANGTSWFLDLPFDRENEIEDYHTDVQFNTFITTETIVGGIHNVVVYDGISWGYKYSTSDPVEVAAVPEPSTFAVWGIALLAVVIVVRRIKPTAARSATG